MFLVKDEVMVKILMKSDVMFLMKYEVTMKLLVKSEMMMFLVKFMVKDQMEMM